MCCSAQIAREDREGDSLNLFSALGVPSREELSRGVCSPSSVKESQPSAAASELSRIPFGDLPLTESYDSLWPREFHGKFERNKINLLIRNRLKPFRESKMPLGLRSGFSVNFSVKVPCKLMSLT